MKKRVRKLTMLVLTAVLLVSGTLAVRQYIYDLQAQESYRQAQMVVQREPVEEPEGPEVQPELIVELPEEPEVPLKELPEIPELPPEPEQEPLEEQAIYLKELNLAELRKTNPDVLGWIRIPGTKLDYPLLQAEDNQYYLKRTWKGERNNAGSIFLECKVKDDFSDFNTIIYGHNMKSGSMFGTLKQYRTQSHYEANPYIYIVDDSGIRRYEIFAAFEADVRGYTYRLDINTPEKKQALLDYSLESSVIEAKIVPTPEDTIITLSTCTGKGYESRWVVQAVLTGRFAEQSEEPAAPTAER